MDWSLGPRLGGGAMAEVFAVRHGDVEGVLKRIRPDQATNPAFVALMETESDALERVRADAVIRLLDAGPGWIVVERGEPLPARVPPRPVVARVLDALVAAHAAGVLHRDVKRENVLLTARGPVLADWGAARITGRPDPAPALGTPRAMAPERLRGEPATEASDVWSVGALAWELATGRAPFDADRWGDLLEAHASGLPPFAGRDLTEGWLRELLDPSPARRPTAQQAARTLWTARPSSDQRGR